MLGFDGYKDIKKAASMNYNKAFMAKRKSIIKMVK